jgi:TolB-like protein
MTSLASYSNKFVLIPILVLFLFPSFACSKEIGKENFVTKKERIRVAVFPIENLSGSMGPVKEIRQMFIEKLRTAGVDVLNEETLEKFMAKHRIRYTGGIDKNTAQAFKQEVDIDSVLITSLEFYSDANPPKISMISRLVSTGDNPSILWMEGVGLAGDDSPGFLNLGLIEDPKVLLYKAMKVMFDSLYRYISKKADGREAYRAKRKFLPKIFYRSPDLDPERKYTVAIVPFFNLSGRKYAGDLMVLHLAKALKKFDNFNVIEFGMVRQTFLELRIIMDQGISLTQAESVLALLNADMILSGNVTDYDDYQGEWGKPKVGFTTQLIAKKGQEVVWSSNSYNEGDDGVFFFDLGKVNTAHAMASQMVHWIGERIAKEEEKRLPPEAALEPREVKDSY